MSRNQNNHSRLQARCSVRNNSMFCAFNALDSISRVQSCSSWRPPGDLITGTSPTSVANRLNFVTYQLNIIWWQVGDIAAVAFVSFFDGRAGRAPGFGRRGRRYWDRLIENILRWREEIVYRLFSSNENKNKIIRRDSCLCVRGEIQSGSNSHTQKHCTNKFELKFALRGRGCRDFRPQNSCVNQSQSVHLIPRPFLIHRSLAIHSTLRCKITIHKGKKREI